MTPRKDGVLLLAGKISPDEPLETYRAAIIQAASNALIAAQNTLSADERIAQVLSLTVYVNATPDYTTHAKIGDVVSEYLYEQLGDAGIGARPRSALQLCPAMHPLRCSLSPPSNSKGKGPSCLRPSIKVTSKAGKPAPISAPAFC